MQLAFRLLIACRIFLSYLTLCNSTSFLTWSVQPIVALHKLFHRFYPEPHPFSPHTPPPPSPNTHTRNIKNSFIIYFVNKLGLQICTSGLSTITFMPSLSLEYTLFFGLCKPHSYFHGKPIQRDSRSEDDIPARIH